MEWKDISTAPKDGTPVELFMPKYQCSARAYYRTHNEEIPTLPAGWVHEGGWQPELGVEYANKRLYSHWRLQDETPPEGFTHRKWDSCKQEYIYNGK